MNRWSRPQLIVSALLFVAVLALALDRPAPVALPDLRLAPSDGSAEARPETRTVTLVVSVPDRRSGELARTRERTELELPRREPERAEAILAALRERMLDEGAWPRDLAPPDAFVRALPGLGSGQAWVVVLPATGGEDASVATERALADALEATARANGASRVAFVSPGRAAGTLLGRIAVPNSLADR